MAQLAQLKEIKATGAEGLKNWAPDKFKSMTAMQVRGRKCGGMLMCAPNAGAVERGEVCLHSTWYIVHDM